MIGVGHKIFSRALAFVLLVLAAFGVRADDNNFPARPNPPRLVNDFAGMMNPRQQEELEAKLVEFDRTTSTQIAVVTIKSLGDYDVSDYAVKLFNQWGIGQAGKNNGVLIFASLGDRKMWITTGRGVEGALTDMQCGQIVRNEMRPAFKEGNYYEGFSKAADAVIAATKGEYKADNKDKNGSPATGLIVLIIVLIIVWIIRRRGGGGGGSYMSGRGFGGFGTGWLIGSMMNRGGGSWGGGSSGGWGGGGGFGGFGGGSSGGGGAGGSW